MPPSRSRRVSGTAHTSMRPGGLRGRSSILRGGSPALLEGMDRSWLEGCVAALGSAAGRVEQPGGEGVVFERDSDILDPIRAEHFYAPVQSLLLHGGQIPLHAQPEQVPQQPLDALFLALLDALPLAFLERLPQHRDLA